MDTTEPVAIETSSYTKRRRRTIEEKRRIVEGTREDSVAHGVDHALTLGFSLDHVLLSSQGRFQYLYNRQASAAVADVSKRSFFDYFPTKRGCETKASSITTAKGSLAGRAACLCACFPGEVLGAAAQRNSG
jgi:hypothetical protein